MSNNIDVVDYAVLKCLDDQGACWKKRVHQWIQEHTDMLPIQENKSIQTIGRRIDRLHDAGLLESCILSPDQVKRDMMIGYKLTEDGRQALAATRDNILRDMVISASSDLLTAEEYGDGTVSVDRAALVALLTDAFDIDAAIQDTVLPQIDTEELLGLVATHFFLDNADSTFSDDSEDPIFAFLSQTPKFRRPFEEDNIMFRLQDRLQNTTASRKTIISTLR